MGWVAGGCWDDEIDNQQKWIIPRKKIAVDLNPTQST
jgi:hypothetical protein